LPEDSQGRVDILILRIAEELGNRLHAETTIDLRDHVKACAVHLIEDMGIPKTPVTPTTIVRSLLGIPDRAVNPVRRKRMHGLRRVV
jgi:hypothetical protein